MNDLTFSQRMGLETRKKIQIDVVDDDLRLRTWNFIYRLYSEFLKEKHSTIMREYIWSNILKHPIDKFPYHDHDFDDEIRKKITSCKWYEFYNIIEEIVDYLSNQSYDPIQDNCKIVFNELFKKENSGYRFIGNKIAPISDEIEVQGIQDALDKSKGRFVGVHTHISTALRHLSEREDPDYRNSMKESISAVEAICRKISGDEKATLGKALSKIEKNTDVKLHNALKTGFTKLYNYTSDAGGIRHGLSDEPDVDVEDAKYMLVSCSAFINYLIVKADKANIFYE